ncbi:hypothetical protein [Streptomyces sp. AC558_RSS880]|uniref:hypothetical protein n=1 Tax=Streptomyces sp. AC558_RSS880 TaxID=2823687 RepID=UPI001C21C054|nr:hypothetical protein [Streptomyces sp. AC558_RSS880]
MAAGGGGGGLARSERFGSDALDLVLTTEAAPVEARMLFGGEQSERVLLGPWGSTPVG